MRPENLHTKIFLDSGDPHETLEVIRFIGFLDGQTTNPTLVAKNPGAQARLARGEKFSKAEAVSFYRGVVEEISGLIPGGSVSIETYADSSTTADEMHKEAREMSSWIPNAHIKFPTTSAGLSAAERAVKEGMRVNMTLCFNQAQAAAVYAATRGAPRRVQSRSFYAACGDVFVSPFVGRLDDEGENGMDLIANILRMYENGDHHVEVLTASVRSLDHFLYALKLKSDIATAPFKVLKEWSEKGMVIPGDDFTYAPRRSSGFVRGAPSGLKSIPYREFDLSKNWREFDIAHELTEAGIKRFAADWNGMIK